MSITIEVPQASIEGAFTTNVAISSSLDNSKQDGQALYRLTTTGDGWVVQGLPSSIFSVVGNVATVAGANVVTGMGPVQVAALGDTAVTKAFQVANAGGTVDVTATLNDATANNTTPFATGVAGDYFAVGYTLPFGPAKFNVGTVGTVGVVVWEYWNGTAWAALAGVTDATTGFKTGPATNTVAFTVPTDWATTSINASAQLYFIRARVTTPFTVNPLLTQGWVDGTLPTGLTAATNYWLIRGADVNTFSFATSWANAVAGTAVTLSTVGTCTVDTVATIGNGALLVRAGNSKDFDGRNGKKLAIIQDSTGGKFCLAPVVRAPD